MRRPKCVKAVHDAVEYLSKGGRRFADYPLAVDIADARFLLVNTSAPSNLLCSWGFMTEENTRWLQEECQRDAEGKKRIILSHYPMYEDYPLLRMRHRLFGQQEVLKLINSGDIALSLCGHVHNPYLKRDENNRPLEECCGSVTRNGSMVEITLDNGNFSFKTIEL